MRKTNTVMFTKCQAEFSSIALKQPKVGSQSSGTPVLVINNVLRKFIFVSTNMFPASLILNASHLSN